MTRSFEEAIASKIVRSIFAKDKSSSDLTCGPKLHQVDFHLPVA